jgi:hypothetical protein
VDEKQRRWQGVNGGGRREGEEEEEEEEEIRKPGRERSRASPHCLRSWAYAVHQWNYAFAPTALYTVYYSGVCKEPRPGA